MAIAKTNQDNLEKFAFYQDFKSDVESAGYDFESLRNNNPKLILEYLLTEKGLNYGNLPKGLIKFHSYSDHCRTPFEEHIVEAMNYTKDKNNIARIHFTVDEKFQSIIESVINNFKFPDIKSVRIEVSYSYQKKSTNTIAVDDKNQPILDNSNRLVFRPGGHGALIENLSQLNADIAIIKNIDNVQPDHKKSDTYLFKKLLCGLLIKIQNQTFEYLKILENKILNNKEIDAIEKFCMEELSVEFPDNYLSLDNHSKSNFLFNKLN